MESMSSRLGLVLFSVFFLIFGVVLSLYGFKKSVFSNICLSGFKVYNTGDSVPSTESSKACYCTKGRVVCSEKNADKVKELEISDFTRTKLKFESKYLSSGVSTGLNSLPLGTSFANISTSKDGIEVVLEQSQMCKPKTEIPVQIGLYNMSGSTLTLLNVVNALESVYTQPCTVSLTYNVYGIDFTKIKDFKLVYQSEDGQKASANICLYNSRVYNQGDNYVAEDNCNLCKCSDGISRCSNDRVCNK